MPVRHLKPRDETEGDKTERLEENSHAELGPTILRPDASTGRNIQGFSENAKFILRRCRWAKKEVAPKIVAGMS